MKEKFAGKFIVLDGPDGCGKSTHSRLLIEWLEEQGVPTVGFRDPGDTEIGEKIRDILLNPDHDKMDTRTELLLYMAARAQLWAEKIRPALEARQCVVLDRWLSSTCAYQGYAGGFGIENVIKIAADCLERVWPDLTVVLDVDLETSRRRLKEQLDRMELKGMQYHSMVREGFLKLAQERDDFVIVSSIGTMDQTSENVWQAVSKYFEGRE